MIVSVLNIKHCFRSVWKIVINHFNCFKIDSNFKEKEKKIIWTFKSFLSFELKTFLKIYVHVVSLSVLHVKITFTYVWYWIAIWVLSFFFLLKIYFTFTNKARIHQYFLHAQILTELEKQFSENLVSLLCYFCNDSVLPWTMIIM